MFGRSRMGWHPGPTSLKIKICFFRFRIDFCFLPDISDFIDHILLFSQVVVVVCVRSIILRHVQVKP